MGLEDTPKCMVVHKHSTDESLLRNLIYQLLLLIRTRVVNVLSDSEVGKLKYEI
jgi:hypothetical protein